MSTTSNENLIANSSYTEKDFQVIYPALLDLVKKLTLKWDPSSSNESDPGVLLLKLNAIIADKCNYNIDKNVLECFPLSVTQDKNARQLFEQLGYYMHWYNSASTVVALKYTIQDTSDSDSSGSETSADTTVQEVEGISYTIPRFTMVCDADSKVVYTIVEEKPLDNDGSIQTFAALQGIAVTYEINGKTVITTADLDSNNRLYFTDTKVAENGVFICNNGANNYSSWVKKDNLLLEDINATNYFYKFGVSQDMSTCYLEFPENAEELFQDGIVITYLTTEGEDGNIAAYALEKFYKDVTVKDPSSTVEGATKSLTADNVSIRNYYTGSGGTNPETIDEAYLGYKKTIGTFKTLVTLRDYMNAVAKSDYISNALVCDRTTDTQSSYDIVTQSGTINQIVNEVELSKEYDISGYFFDNEFYTDADHKKKLDPDEDKNYLDITEDSSGNPKNISYRVIYNTINGIQTHTYVKADAVEKPTLTAFDLKMYLLSAVGLITNATAFNKTFSLVTDESITAIVDAELEDNKLVQHNVSKILDDRVCFIKNKYPLNCTIIPQYSVTEAQSAEIAENIRKALYNNLNSANLSFGDEISYETVYNIILNADTRIKAVALDRLTYTSYAVYIDSSTRALTELPINTYDKFYMNTATFNESVTLSTISSQKVMTTIKVLNKDTLDTFATASGMEFTLNGSKFTISLLNYKEGSKTAQSSFLLYDSSSSTKWKLSNKKYKFTDDIETDYPSFYNWLCNNAAITYSEEDISISNTKKNNFMIDIYAKSVLAGKTQFFVKDTDFDYGINQKYQLLERSIGRLDATVDIKFDSNTGSSIEPYTYTMRENETIQLLSPSLLESENYSTNVRYECTFPIAEGEDSAYIPANSAYQLKKGDYIAFYLSSSAENSSGYDYHIFGEGTIIKPSFAITKNPQSKISSLLFNTYVGLDRLKDKTINNHTYKYAGGNSYNEIQAENFTSAIKALTSSENVLSGNKQVNIMVTNQVTLNKTSNWCYWVLNEKENDRYYLFKVTDTKERILQAGEYFIYTTTQGSDMHILGAGTRITLNSYITSDIFVEAMDYSEIVNNGILALTDYWYILNDIEFSVEEMQYLLFGDGVLVNIKPKNNIGFILKETFIGDGVKKSFDIKNELISIINVKIGSQEVTDYTLSGSTITFTTPPDENAKITVTLYSKSIVINSESKVSLSNCVIRYKSNINDNWTTVSDVIVGDSEENWLATTKLRLNSSKSTAQYIQNNQKIYYYYYNPITKKVDSTYSGVIDPNQQEWGGEAYLLTSRIINNVGGINVSTLEKDNNDENQPIDIYAYVLGTMSDDVKILDNGSTMVLFQEKYNTYKENVELPNNYIMLISEEGSSKGYITTKLIKKSENISFSYIKSKGWVKSYTYTQEQEKFVTFRLPAGDYIMPVYHDTDVDVIDKLLMYINKNQETEQFELLYPMGTSEADKKEENANLYISNNYYLDITDLPDGSEDRTFFITVKVKIRYKDAHSIGEYPVVAVVIPPIFKYSDSDSIVTDKMLNASLFTKINNRIKELDLHKSFDYTYEVDTDYEVKSPLDSNSFLNTNHILNPATISQLDTSDLNIYITNKIKG